MTVEDQWRDDLKELVTLSWSHSAGERPDFGYVERNLQDILTSVQNELEGYEQSQDDNAEPGSYVAPLTLSHE